MKMRLSKRFLRFLTSSFVGAFVSLMVVPAFAQEGGFVVDKIVAKVDNYIVLKSELESAYQNYITDGNPPSEPAKCDLLNRLVVNKLLVAKAEIDSVVVSDGEVDASTQQRMQMKSWCHRQCLGEHLLSEATTLSASLQIQGHFSHTVVGRTTIEALKAEPALVATLKQHQPQRSPRRLMRLKPRPPTVDRHGL